MNYWLLWETWGSSGWGCRLSGGSLCHCAKHVPLDSQLFVGRLLNIDHNLFVHAWPQFEALSVLVLWYGTDGHKESFQTLAWVNLTKNRFYLKMTRLLLFWQHRSIFPPKIRITAMCLQIIHVENSHYTQWWFSLDAHYCSNYFFNEMIINWRLNCISKSVIHAEICQVKSCSKIQ